MSPNSGVSPFLVPDGPVSGRAPLSSPTRLSTAVIRSERAGPRRHPRYVTWGTYEENALFGRRVIVAPFEGILESVSG